MPRTLHLCAITSHVPVEIGDIIYPPGFGGPGELVSIPPGMSLGGEAKMKVGGAVLVTSADALGLVWIDEVYTLPRGGPDVVFDHRPGTLIYLPKPAYLKDKEPA